MAVSQQASLGSDDLREALELPSDYDHALLLCFVD